VVPGLKKLKKGQLKVRKRLTLKNRKRERLRIANQKRARLKRRKPKSDNNNFNYLNNKSKFNVIIYIHTINYYYHLSLYLL
jgi:hypothetical protein